MKSVARIKLARDFRGAQGHFQHAQAAGRAQAARLAVIGFELQRQAAALRRPLQQSGVADGDEIRRDGRRRQARDQLGADPSRVADDDADQRRAARIRAKNRDRLSPLVGAGAARPLLMLKAGR
jgi:hypothetical protein